MTDSHLLERDPDRIWLELLEPFLGREKRCAFRRWFWMFLSGSLVVLLRGRLADWARFWKIKESAAVSRRSFITSRSADTDNRQLHQQLNIQKTEMSGLRIKSHLYVSGFVS